MTLADNVRRAIKQLALGETIGRRGTPVISFWDMRPKWEKWGSAWQYIGSDGPPFREQSNLVCPALIKLVYLRTHDGRVCQLAYEFKPEINGNIGCQSVEMAIREFEFQTSKHPREIA